MAGVEASLGAEGGIIEPSAEGGIKEHSAEGGIKEHGAEGGIIVSSGTAGSQSSQRSTEPLIVNETYTADVLIGDSKRSFVFLQHNTVSLTGEYRHYSWYMKKTTKQPSRLQMYIKLTRSNDDDSRKHPLQYFCLKCHI